MPDFGRWTSNGGDPSLNEINRTDQFLDALATQQPVYATDRGEAELANLLAGWRDDVRETPIAELVTTNEAALALDRVTSPGRRRRLSLAVVGSAAAAVLCIGGFGAVVAGSGPGDALYGLRTMLFGEQTATRDDAVVLAAQTEMQQVQQLIDQGDWQGAQDKLKTITTTVATVNDVERKQELVTQWQELTVKVEAKDAAATVEPGAPLPTFPDVPVVSLNPDTLIPLTPGSSETTTSSPAVTSSETTSSTSETTSGSPSSTPSSTSSPTPSSTSSPTPSSTPSPTPSSPQSSTPSRLPRHPRRRPPRRQRRRHPHHHCLRVRRRRSSLGCPRQRLRPPPRRHHRHPRPRRRRFPHRHRFSRRRRPRRRFPRRRRARRRHRHLLGRCRPPRRQRPSRRRTRSNNRADAGGWNSALSDSRRTPTPPR